MKFLKRISTAAGCALIFLILTELFFIFFTKQGFSHLFGVYVFWFIASFIFQPIESDAHTEVFDHLIHAHPHNFGKDQPDEKQKRQEQEFYDAYYEQQKQEKEEEERRRQEMQDQKEAAWREAQRQQAESDAAWAREQEKNAQFDRDRDYYHNYGNSREEDAKWFS